jgi:hypothetical protein
MVFRPTANGRDSRLFGRPMNCSATRGRRRSDRSGSAAVPQRLR